MVTFISYIDDYPNLNIHILFVHDCIDLLCYVVQRQLFTLNSLGTHNSQNHNQILTDFYKDNSEVHVRCGFHAC